MILPDVNVLVYVHREEAPDHRAFSQWWQDLISSDEAVGIADLVLSGFLRIVTHPRIFDPPTPLETALQFVEQIRSLPNYVEVAPGQRHWDIFTNLSRTARAKGNLIPDAYLAALAIESGSEWITADRDYARFAGLRWRHPLV